MKNSIEEIKNIISEWQGHPFDACVKIINIISTADVESWEIVKEVLSTPIRIGDGEAELQEIDEDEYSRYIYRYRNYLSALSEALSMKDADQDEFYKDLYHNVFESDIIPEDQYHQALYLHLLSDQIKLLPYFPTHNLLKLQEEEYREILEHIRPQLNMAFHMCARKFDTRSETTSQYWEIAKQLNTREEQIVFWSVVMQMENKNTNSKSV